MTKNSTYIRNFLLPLAFYTCCFFAEAVPPLSSSVRTLRKAILSSHEQQKQEDEQRRHLQTFFTYVARTPIADPAAIDLDQQEIEHELSRATQNSISTGFINAVNVYTYGAHSKSYAFIALREMVTFNISASTSVVGYNSQGGQIIGRVHVNVQAYTNLVQILYPTTDDVTNHVGCQVGASMHPMYDGCFAESGNLTFGNSNIPLQYEYDMATDNRNDRTIRRFSLEAAQDMLYDCDDENEIAINHNAMNHIVVDTSNGNQCAFKDYLKFLNYYGMPDYADEWITAAFRAQKTGYGADKGNADFSTLTEIGRSEAIKAGTVYMSIWMQVIGKMEQAISGCTTFCRGGNSASGSTACNMHNNVNFLKLWDEAVAFYTGSLQGADLTTDFVNTNDMTQYPDRGFLLFQLANDRCTLFNTCTSAGSLPLGHAKINYDIFDEFMSGQEQLISGNCIGAIATKEKIVSLMMVPLIQGTIQTAFVLHNENNNGNQNTQSEYVRAEGATAAAAILPMIDWCSPSDAEIIYETMKLSADSPIHTNNTRFTNVKEALERNYKCLGVTCVDVGGLVDISTIFSSDPDESPYLPRAEPCNDHGHDYSIVQQNEESGDDPTTTATTTTSSTPPTTTTASPNRDHSSTPHREHHHHFYQMKEFSVPVQAGISIGLFITMFCVTLLCCLTWRTVPPPITFPDEVAPMY